METISLTEGSRCVSPGGGENVEGLSNRAQMQSRMLYVTVGQHDDSYPFPPSRVSPLDPNLNSVQYLSSHQVSGAPQQTSSDLIQYSDHGDQHFPANSQFSPNSQEALTKSTNIINSNLVLEGIDSTHFSSDNGNLLSQDPNLVPNHFNGYVNHMPVLNDLDANLPSNGSNVSYSNIANAHSPIDTMQQLSLRNESLEYINIDANVDPNYITQLNSGPILVKQNSNGRYFQQIINTDNIVINNQIPDASDITEEIGIPNNGLLSRISENLLSELQENDEMHLQNITLNRNVDLNRFLQNNEQLIDTKIITKSSLQNKNTFKKYVIPQNISESNKKSAMKSNLFVTAGKKNTNKKTREAFISSPVDNQLLPQNGIVNSSDQNSDSLAVSPIDLYENSSSYDFVSQQNDENCVSEENGHNPGVEDNEAREDYLVVDGGFLIEQSSGDLMVCQQLDGQLAIDQSMLDMKLNQMLNMNQDLNLAFNYDDQIILDQNGRILLKTEMAGELEKDGMLSNDVVFNNLNISENLDQDLLIENEMNDIDMKMNIINDIGGEDVDSKFVDDKNEQKAESEIRRSKRSVKTNDAPQKPNVFTITDKTVLSRAWASLPATYLSISKINTTGNETVYGVFARRPIPERTQFGPLEGVQIITKAECDTDDVQYRIKVDGGFAIMDVSDENTSNWMRFVRSAQNRSTQNLVMSEDGGKLYFTTIRHIKPKTELRVWYSEEYANDHGFKLLALTNDEKLEIDDSKYSWPCYECLKRFATSDDLHRHLNEHDNIKKSSKLPEDNDVKTQNSRTKRVRTNLFNKKITKSKHTNEEKNECDVCCRTFPRRYSLKRHMQTHKLKNLPGMMNSAKRNIVHNTDIKQKPPENIQETNKASSIKQEILDIADSSMDKDTSKKTDQNNEQNPGNEKKSLKCSLCPKVFSLFKDRLEHHMSIHQNEENKTYVCSQCPKKFFNLTALTCHLKSHPWLKCPMCDKNFTVVGALREHVKVHCINGYFTCNHCKKKFSQYRLIRKHIRAFHSDRKLPCPQCNKIFPAQDKLRMHLLRHSDHREFLCAHCGKQFKRKDKLTEHMKCAHEQQQSTQNGNNVHEKPDERKFESNNTGNANDTANKPKKFMPRVSPNDYHRFIYKCHSCLLGFKRRGMLVNHLAKRHPEIKPESVPELNLPILRTTRNYYCQYCCKVYKSSSKRKAHILKIHPGLSLPLSNRHRGGMPEIPGMPNPTYSQTVGSVTSHPHPCPWCHKQYASKAKLLQHQRKKHNDKLAQVNENQNINTANGSNNGVLQNSQNQYFKVISQQQHHQISENQQHDAEVQLQFESLDPDDPACYTDDLSDVKIVQDDNYDNYELDQEEVHQVQTVTPSVTLKLEKTPIIIDVSQLDQYRKAQIAKQQDNRTKVVNTKSVLTETLNRPPKKWANNFPFISYPAR